MLRGLYQSATGMLTMEIRQKEISNNIANANTTGFKSQKTTFRTFPEVLLYRLSKDKITPIGHYTHGVMVDRMHTNFTQGPLEQTGHNTDLAFVDPPGTQPAFWTVQAGDTEAYTRNGEFRVDADGFLVTLEGYTVQGQYGAVYVGTDDFQVDLKGQIIVEGQVVDQLRVVTFDDLSLLQRRGNNLYTSAPGVVPLTPANYQIKQGWLEKSNIDIAGEMIDMLAVVRTFGMNQKLVQAADQVLGKSVNEIGRLR